MKKCAVILEVVATSLPSVSMVLALTAVFLTSVSIAPAADLNSDQEAALTDILQKALGPEPGDAVVYEVSVTKDLDEVPHGRTDCTVIAKEPVYNDKGRLIGYSQRRQCPHVD